MVHVVDLFLVIRELLDGRLAADARNLLDEKDHQEQRGVQLCGRPRTVRTLRRLGQDLKEVRGALWCCRLSGRSR